MKTRIAICAGAALLALPLGAARAGEATIQDNALACRSEKGQYGSWARDFNGITNISTGSRRVFCPLSVPTYDSSTSTNPDVNGLRVVYTTPSSAVAPTCSIYTMNRGAGAEWSAAGTKDIVFFPFTIRFDGFRNTQRAVSIGYVCDVPPGVTLQGAFFRSTINEIVGGV
jgi:hypothetical protein